MKNLKTFDEFLNEGYSVNLKRGSDRLTSIDNEILQIALKGLPKNIISNIESVEGHGSWTQTFETPNTIKNKTGVTSYNFISIHFKNPIGKMTSLIVGLKKRTSGPGSGYIMLCPTGGSSMPYSNIKILPGYGGIASEFYEDEIETIKELYDNEVKPKI